MQVVFYPKICTIRRRRRRKIFTMFPFKYYKIGVIPTLSFTDIISDTKIQQFKPTSICLRSRFEIKSLEIYLI